MKLKNYTDTELETLLHDIMVETELRRAIEKVKDSINIAVCDDIICSRSHIEMIHGTDIVAEAIERGDIIEKLVDGVDCVKIRPIEN